MSSLRQAFTIGYKCKSAHNAWSNEANLSRDDFAYILTTFPVLEKNEERKYGEYRTARLALAAYDALAPLMANRVSTTVEG